MCDGAEVECFGFCWGEKGASARGDGEVWVWQEG